MANVSKDMKKVTFDLDDKDYEGIEKEASKNQRSVSAQIRFIIKEWCKQ